MLQGVTRFVIHGLSSCFTDSTIALGSKQKQSMNCLCSCSTLKPSFSFNSYAKWQTSILNNCMYNTYSLTLEQWMVPPILLETNFSSTECRMLDTGLSLTAFLSLAPLLNFLCQLYSPNRGLNAFSLLHIVDLA